jgi:diacylglycerol kinase family enzyme
LIHILAFKVIHLLGVVLFLGNIIATATKRQERPYVRVEAADWVRVEGGANTPVQVDGEMLGALPVEISLHPQRLQLILPVM